MHLKRLSSLLLLQNVQPKNKSYKYDFFYNNCATKIKDDLVAIVNDSILFLPYKNYRAMTFRELIRSHIPQNSWGGFGIDLALGSKIDQKRATKPDKHRNKNNHNRNQRKKKRILF